MIIRYPSEIKDIINTFDTKQFEALIQNNFYNISFLGYYYKRLSKTHQSILLNSIKKSFDTYNTSHRYNLPYALRIYSKKERKLIMSNLWFFQISFGCTKGCYFCWCDAPFFHNPISIPFNHIKYTLRRFSDDFKKNYTYLYRASDPLDYKRGNRSYKHILKLHKRVLHRLPYTSTAVNHQNLGFYKEIQESVTRVSYLGSNKNIYANIQHLIHDDTYEWYSIKDTRFNGLNWFMNQKYDNGILCLHGTVITPFFAYNLVNLWKCNNFFPQWLLSFPIIKIKNNIIKQWDNLLDHMTSKVVMYDFVDKRSYRGKYNKVVVFLQDFQKIYMTICSKNKMNEGYIEIINVMEISYQKYYHLCFTLEWYSILFSLESWENKTS